MVKTLLLIKEKRSMNFVKKNLKSTNVSLLSYSVKRTVYSATELIQNERNLVVPLDKLQCPISRRITKVLKSLVSLLL
jgi:hypothetical protein